MIAIAVVAIVFLAVYAWFDPEGSALFPRCPVKMLSGYDCPGCGSQRAMHALLHGDIASAWSYNAMMVVMIPVVTLLLAVEALRARMPRLYARVNRQWLYWAIFAAVIIWTILRNVI